MYQINYSIARDLLFDLFTTLNNENKNILQKLDVTNFAEMRPWNRTVNT